MGIELNIDDYPPEVSEVIQLFWGCGKITELIVR